MIESGYESDLSCCGRERCHSATRCPVLASMHAPSTLCCHETRNASLQKAEAERGVTEIGKMAGRGHSLTIDAGWREVVEKALEFVKRFA